MCLKNAYVLAPVANSHTNYINISLKNLLSRFRVLSQ